MLKNIFNTPQITDQICHLTNYLQYIEEKYLRDDIYVVINRIFNLNDGWQLETLCEDESLEFESIYNFLRGDGVFMDILLKADASLEYYLAKFIYYPINLTENNYQFTLKDSLYDFLFQNYCDRFFNNHTQRNVKINPMKYSSLKNFKQKLFTNVLNLPTIHSANYLAIIFTEIYAEIMLDVNKLSNINLMMSPELIRMNKIFLCYLFNFSGLYLTPDENRLDFENQKPTSPQSIVKAIIFPKYINPIYYEYFQYMFSHWPILPTFQWVLNVWLTFIQPWKCINQLDDDPPIFINRHDYIVRNKQFYINIFGLYLNRLMQEPLNAKNLATLKKILKIYDENHVILLLNKCYSSDQDMITLKSFIQTHFLPKLHTSYDWCNWYLQKHGSTYFGKLNYFNDSQIEHNLIPGWYNLFRTTRILQYLCSHLLSLKNCFTLSFCRWFTGRGIIMEWLTFHFRYAYYYIKFNHLLTDYRQRNVIDASPLFLTLMAIPENAENYHIDKAPSYENKFLNQPYTNPDFCVLENSLPNHNNGLGSWVKKHFGMYPSHSFISANNNHVNMEKGFKDLEFCIKCLEDMFEIPHILKSSKRSNLTDSGYKSDSSSFITHNTSNINHFLDEKPIRSYECAWLVKLLCILTKILNQKYETRLKLIYMKRDLVSTFLQFLLTPFVTFERNRSYQTSYLYSSPLKAKNLIGPKPSATFRPVIDLRYWANYYFLLHMVVGFLVTYYTLYIAKQSLFNWPLTIFLFLLFASAVDTIQKNDFPDFHENNAQYSLPITAKYHNNNNSMNFSQNQNFNNNYPVSNLSPGYFNVESIFLCLICALVLSFIFYFF